MVEDLGLACSGVGNQALIQNVQNILADLLKFGLDLVSVLTDGGDVLIGALGLLLLLDRRDDSPRGTSGSDDVLVGNREEVTLVNRELSAKLSNLLHVGNHLIVTFSLLAKASKEGLAVEKCSLVYFSPYAIYVEQRYHKGGDAQH